MKRFALLFALLVAGGAAVACGQDSTDLDYPVTPSAGSLGGANDQGSTTGNNGGGGGNTGNLGDAGVGDGGTGFGDGGTGFGDGGPGGFDDGGLSGGGDADTTGIPTGIDAGSDTTQDQTPPLPDQIP